RSPDNQGTPRLGLNLARGCPNLGSLAHTGLPGRCWERSRSPALARSCGGASDKGGLVDYAVGTTCFLRVTRRTCQPDAMPVMNCLCGWNYLPGQCCPHGVRLVDIWLAADRGSRERSA